MLLCKSLLLGGEWLHILSPPNLLSSQALLRTCSIQARPGSPVSFPPTNLGFGIVYEPHLYQPASHSCARCCFQKLNKLLSSIDLREKNMIILLGRHVPFPSYSSASSSSSSEKRLKISSYALLTEQNSQPSDSQCPLLISCLQYLLKSSRNACISCLFIIRYSFSFRPASAEQLGSRPTRHTCHGRLAGTAARE